MTDSAIDVATTNTPARPTDRVSCSGTIISATKPTITVPPEVMTVRDAVRIVSSAASSRLGAYVQLLAEPRDHQQRVVDADAEADHRA